MLVYFFTIKNNAFIGCYMKILNKIELLTLAEYYLEHLSNKSFKFKIKLKSSKDIFDIDIRFFDESMPHLLGIQKIVEIFTIQRSVQIPLVYLSPLYNN